MVETAVTTKEWENRDLYLSIINRENGGIIPSRVRINHRIVEQAPDGFFQAKQEECPHVDVVFLPHDKKNGRPRTEIDEWGCTVQFPGDFLMGQVTGHPLSDWGALKQYNLPDPEQYRDWDDLDRYLRNREKEGLYREVGVDHGFFYLKLTDLRGFENFMIDVAEERKELFELADRVCDYWCRVVSTYVWMGADIISFGDDLGHQSSFPFDPVFWRKLLKPRYKKMFDLCRNNGVEVYFHTDGYILPVIDDLIEAGVTILNPQDIVNGLDNLKQLIGRRIAVYLDIDRQNTTFFGTKVQIERHVENCVKTLGSPQGGLMFNFGAWPGTPYQNVGYIIESFEKYFDWWE